LNDNADVAASNGANYAVFLAGWGVEMALVLQVEEKTTLDPTMMLTPPMPKTSVFTLGATALQTADATRIDKVNFYYTIKELYLGRGRKCIRDENPTPGSFLVQSDLKLSEWLHSYVDSIATGQVGTFGSASGPYKQNVLSHEVKFEAISTGSVTPAWKLVRVAFDQTGSLLAGTRDRTHDLIVTFGPLDKTQKGSFLIPIAENTHIFSIMTSGVNSAIGGATTP
jgi:hypothetical protein